MSFNKLPMSHKCSEDIPTEKEGPFESPSMRKFIVDYVTLLIDEMEKMKDNLQTFDGELPDDHDAMVNLAAIHKWIHCIQDHINRERKGFSGGSCCH